MKITQEEFHEAMAVSGGDYPEQAVVALAKNMKASRIVADSVKNGEISEELGEVLEWLIYGKQ